MGLRKKRAGLFILDRAGYTCCVVRSRPYAKRTKDVSVLKETNDNVVMVEGSDAKHAKVVYESNKTNDNVAMVEGSVVKPAKDVCELRRSSGKVVLVQGIGTEPAKDMTELREASGKVVLVQGIGTEPAKDMTELRKASAKVVLVQGIGTEPVKDLCELRKTSDNTLGQTKGVAKYRNLATESFLEMIQIPRGSREKRDPDLLRTALREFCEETLCVNRNIRILEKPVALFWDDSGYRWWYDIYIAFAEDLLYFAFEPARMKKAELVFDSADGWRRCYSAFTTEISRSADGVQFNLIVMHVRDYLDYMKNCQLKFYGENNYNVLFHHLDTYTTDRMLNGFSYDSLHPQKETNISEEEDSEHDRSSDNPRYCAKEKRVSIMTKEMYNFITNNTDMYVQKVVKSVYTSYDDNRNMCRRWYRWWRRLTDKGVCGIPIVAV